MAEENVQLKVRVPPHVKKVVERLGDDYNLTNGRIVTNAVQALDRAMGLVELAVNEILDAHGKDAAGLYLRFAREAPGALLATRTDIGLNHSQVHGPVLRVDEWLIARDPDNPSELLISDMSDTQVGRIVDGEIRLVRLPTGEQLEEIAAIAAGN